MPDLFRDFTPEEFHKYATGHLDMARDRMPAHFKDGDRLAEGYQYLSGRIQDKSKLKYDTYCNELYDAWKGWAPKFCSRPPNYMVRPGSREDQALADACQELFRYRVNRFDYQQMILQCCQDAVILGVGYARHQWDEKRGLTVTSRFKPQNVFWDASAKTFASAKFVIEKHTLPRWQFIEKFGKEVGWEVNAADEDCDPGFWPEESKWMKDGKSPMDPVAYYLFWTTEGDRRRVYAFHEDWCEDYLEPASRKANRNLGEEWKFDFDEGEWHITPLVPTVLNDSLEGISVWEIVRGPYIAYQNVRGAVIQSALQACKVPIVHPEEMNAQIRQIEKTGETFFSVSYQRELLEQFQGKGIDDLVFPLAMGKVSGDLVNLMNQLQQNVQQLSGSSAVSQIQPGGVETAAEATKLADAAANRVADDQGAVERWTNKIGRKELSADLGRIPKLSVCKWTMPEDDESEDPARFGEHPKDEYGPNYVRNVPYMDAILLAKGPASDKAALRMEAAREEARNKSFYGNPLGGEVSQNETDADAAEEQIPVTPEVAVRRNYGVPVLADVEICNPGVEQFIPAENAPAWPERTMDRREVEKMFAVKIETGTSSGNSRMQRVQEIGMVAKEVLPLFQQLGLHKQSAAMLNAIVSAPELQALDDCKVSEEELAQAQQAMQEAAMAQEAAKNQPQGPVELDPNVAIKADAEKHKTDVGLETQREKTTQQRIKLEGDQIRERTQNISQLMMNGMNGVA